MDSIQPIDQQRNGISGHFYIASWKGVISVEAKHINYQCHERLSLLDVVAKPDGVRLIEIERSS